jgi:hypothetical protein
LSVQARGFVTLIQRPNSAFGKGFAAMRRLGAGIFLLDLIYLAVSVGDGGAARRRDGERGGGLFQALAFEFGLKTQRAPGLAGRLALIPRGR